MYILNNLTVSSKEFDGKFTYSKGDRRSQNDLCISNITGLYDIEMFSIHELALNFSDHCPISVCFNLTMREESLTKTVSEDLLSQSDERVQKRPKQLHKSDVNWNAFKNSATRNLLEITNELNGYNLDTQEGLNEASNKVEDCLYNTAIQCRISHQRGFVNASVFNSTINPPSNANEIAERITKAKIEKWDRLLLSKDTKEL